MAWAYACATPFPYWNLRQIDQGWQNGLPNGSWFDQRTTPGSRTYLLTKKPAVLHPRTKLKLRQKRFELNAKNHFIFSTSSLAKFPFPNLAKKFLVLSLFKKFAAPKKRLEKLCTKNWMQNSPMKSTRKRPLLFHSASWDRSRIPFWKTAGG